MLNEATNMREGFETKLDGYSIEDIRQVDKRICHFYFVDLHRWNNVLVSSKEPKELEEKEAINKELGRLRKLNNGTKFYNWKDTYRIYIELTNHNQKTTERKILEWLESFVLNKKKEINK